MYFVLHNGGARCPEQENEVRDRIGARHRRMRNRGTVDEKRPERLLRLREVQKRVPLGRTTIYNKVRRGEFPQPVSLGPNTVAWRESQVDEWIGLREPSNKVT